MLVWNLYLVGFGNFLMFHLICDKHALVSFPKEQFSFMKNLPYIFQKADSEYLNPLRNAKGGRIIPSFLNIMEFVFRSKY